MKLPKIFLTACVAALLTMTAPLSWAAILVDPGTLTATAGSARDSGLSTGREAQFAVDGSGMTGDAHTNDMGSAGSITMWNTTNKAGWKEDEEEQEGNSDWLKVDLGAPILLEEMKIWNFNWLHSSGSLSARGAKDITVWYSADSSDPGGTTEAVQADPSRHNDNTEDPTFDPAGTSWIKLGEYTLTQAPATADYDTPDVIDFGGNEARWVLLHIHNSHETGVEGAADQNLGLSEVQFFAVPEPATMTLLGFGGLMALARRRRR